MSTFVDIILCLHTGSASAERMGRGEMGGVTHSVTCTWWLLWLVVELLWLALVGPILALVAQKTLLSPCRIFISGSEGDFGSELVFAG